MPDNMTRLSDFIVRNPDVMTFADLLVVIGEHGKAGATMLQVDIKPDFADTPRNWETMVENAFTWGAR
jgi:hypothetical protein